MQRKPRQPSHRQFFRPCVQYLSRPRMAAAMIAVSLAAAFSPPVEGAAEEQPRRPNVIVILTDDQGYGDVGAHGNPVINTPVLDRMAREGVEFTQFYVSPVCAPTRASLMTGRYNYRTGVVDTFIGRAMMYTEEVTIAEMLRAAGYRTGIFGKWHLGDNYPLRPEDQGFDEVLVHRGGGIGQPADPPGNRYQDPVLVHNGADVQATGYCSDVFTDGAMRFIEQSGDEPFFAYLAFNCPHTPLEVPDEYYLPYAGMNLAHSEFPDVGFPLPARAQQAATARIYGMVTNIDDNLGRLFAKLDELELTDDTIVIFFTDNGPQQVRYNAGLHGRKGSVYDGGVRVPCFVRWPSRLEPGKKIDRIAAHIDLAPTLLAACGATAPADVAFDGVNLLPLLAADASEGPAWPARTLFFQWHRGDVPQLNRAFAARTDRYKLVQAVGVNSGGPESFVFELFDMHEDPYEQHDLAEEHPTVVAELRRAYEAWFADVSATRGYDPPRIRLGSPHENPVILTRQDWRGPRASWDADALGHWEVEVEEAAVYDVTLRFARVDSASSVEFKLADVRREAELSPGASEFTFQSVALPAGPGRVEAMVATVNDTAGDDTAGDGATVGVHYVDVLRRP